MAALLPAHCFTKTLGGGAAIDPSERYSGLKKDQRAMEITQRLLRVRSGYASDNRPVGWDFDVATSWKRVLDRLFCSCERWIRPDSTGFRKAQPSVRRLKMCRLIKKARRYARQRNFFLHWPLE